MLYNMRVQIVLSLVTICLKLCAFLWIPLTITQLKLMLCYVRYLSFQFLRALPANSRGKRGCESWEDWRYFLCFFAASQSCIIVIACQHSTHSVTLATIILRQLFCLFCLFITCPIAIAQQRTDYKITCVCLSFCQFVSLSVNTPTAAILIRFWWNFAQ